MVAALATAITGILVGFPGVSNWVSSWLPTDVKGLTELAIVGFVLLWWWQFQAARAMNRLSERVAAIENANRSQGVVQDEYD